MTREGRSSRRGRRLALAALALLSGALMAVAPPAPAPAPVEPKAEGHIHHPDESGHPLRLIAYAAHPVGVIIDTLVFRPANWLVHWEPLRTLFGHDDR